MPSPIGHALAGVAAAWTADLVPGDRGWRTAPASTSWSERAGNGLTIVCAALGVAPDVDLLFSGHRTITHSLGAVIFVGLFAAALAANARRPIARVALMCAAAYGTHVLLDWLGADYYPPRGIQALWPFSRQWFISDLDVFRQTARQQFTTGRIIQENILAVLQEILILTPVLILLWLVRVEALAGLPTQVTRRDHAAK